MGSCLVNPHFPAPTADLLRAPRHEDREVRNREHLRSISAPGWLIIHFKEKRAVFIAHFQLVSGSVPIIWFPFCRENQVSSII